MFEFYAPREFIAVGPGSGSLNQIVELNGQLTNYSKKGRALTRSRSSVQRLAQNLKLEKGFLEQSFFFHDG
jgi:hypothetical protein